MNFRNSFGLWFGIVGAFVFITEMAVTERHAKCFLAVDEGTCSDQILRWFFNNKTGHCETFLYSGCGGNANNFNSTMYCLHACNGTAGNTHKYSLPAKVDENAKKQGVNNEAEAKMSSVSKRRLKRNRLNVTKSGSLRTIRPVHTVSVSESRSETVNLKDILVHLSRSVSKLEKFVYGKMSKNVRNSRVDSPSMSSNSGNFRSNARPASSKVMSPKIADSAASESSEERQASVTHVDANTSQVALVDNKANLKTPDVDAKQNTNKLSQYFGINDKDYVRDVEEQSADEDEKTRSQLDVKIKTIINDPSYVFSYRNISAQDMSVLKEVVMELDAEALRFVSFDGGQNKEIGKPEPKNVPNFTFVPTILMPTSPPN